MSIEDLMERLNADSEYWKPEAAGDSLVGVVVAVGKRTVEWQGRSREVPHITVKTPDGRYVDVTAMRTVLEREIEEAEPFEGDTIGFKYLGKPEGKDYEKYKVVVQRGAAYLNRPAGPSAFVSAPAASAPVAQAEEMF